MQYIQKHLQEKKLARGIDYHSPLSNGTPHLCEYIQTIANA